MKSKAQVTIFLILGITILIFGSIFFYYQSITTEESEFNKLELAPIQIFIENCIDQTSTNALIKLGLNGGFLEFPNSINANPRSYLSSGPVTDIKNPYWWYEGINGEPTQEFVKQQLEKYIDNELKTCFNDFKDFKEFKVDELGPIKSEVNLAENDVVVKVNYPINVLQRENNTITKLENFKKTIPIRLKKAMEFASEIMKAENRDKFLEKKTIDLMVLDKEIPTTDIEATCDQRIWKYNEVSSKIKKLLTFNLPYIRIFGSNYADDIYVANPSGKETYKNSYYQNHYLWQVSDELFPDFNVAFTFNDNWPFDLEARPRKGNLLESKIQRGSDLLNFFCLHIWHFTYDLIYPVKVTITEKNNAYRPYSFSFTFMVSIDHNQPNRQNFARTIYDSIETITSEEFCNDVTNEVTIYTVSNTTNELIDIVDVELSLICGRYKCDLGKTEWLSFGAAGGMIKETPYCVKAILKGKKEGYLDSQTFIQTDTPNSYTLHLKPIKEFNNYEVVKHSFADISNEKSLSSDEKASIQIKAVKKTHETNGFYPVEGDFPLQLLNEETNYEVTIYLSNEDELIGGYQQEWLVSENDLFGKNKIKFHVMDQSASSEEERSTFFLDLKTQSEQIPSPELI